MRLERRVFRFRRLAAEWQAKAEAAEALYFEKRPLLPQEKHAILTAFDGGRPLCCDAGREVLRGLGLSTLWVAEINSWAYDSLGCNKGSDSAYFREKLVKFLGHDKSTKADSQP